MAREADADPVVDPVAPLSSGGMTSSGPSMHPFTITVAAGADHAVVRVPIDVPANDALADVVLFFQLAVIDPAGVDESDSGSRHRFERRVRVPRDLEGGLTAIDDGLGEDRSPWSGRARRSRDAPPGSRDGCAAGIGSRTAAPSHEPASSVKCARSIHDGRDGLAFRSVKGATILLESRSPLGILRSASLWGFIRRPGVRTDGPRDVCTRVSWDGLRRRFRTHTDSRLAID
jgi:hypothetical protein